MALNDASIGILGFGGHAREVEAYIDMPVGFFAVDKEYISDGLVDIDNPTQNEINMPVLAAIGSPYQRKRLLEKWQGKKYAQAISQSAVIDKNVIIGEGVQIGPGSIIMTSSKLGNHTIININATISHDCNIGDFATISPGVNIGGKVTLGDGVFIGIGAVISSNVQIASGCVIGAGAVVLDNVTQENSVVVGLPAKPVKQNDGWLREI